MPEKLIQEQFGEAVLVAIRGFARNDLGDPNTYETTYFAHVADGDLRTALAETLYGARWLYKLGLALLVRDAEQLAHVRAQIFDYASICEGLLGEMVRHAIASRATIGQKHKFKNTKKLSGPISWTNEIHSVFEELSFFWCIEVAHDERIIDDHIRSRLHTLRKQRNSVHLRSRTHKAYIDKSRSAYEILLDTIQQTRDWRNAHP